jgi:DNA-binding PadR family transcriptional regulator
VTISHLPLREVSYLVLAALQDGPLHGYAILKRLAAEPTVRATPAAPTLYTTLDRLAADGHIAVDREEIVNGRTRRFYALTPQGVSALRAEARRLSAAASLVTGYTLGPSAATA